MGVNDWLSHHLSLVVTVVVVAICIVAGGAPISHWSRREEQRLADLVAWATARHWTFDKVGNEIETGRYVKQCVIAARPPPG